MFKSWWTWAKARPTVIMNLVGLLVIILGGGAYITYELTKPLDVLSNWTIEVSDAREYRTIDGVKTAIFNPGDSLVFVSESTKLVNSKGFTTRTIICEATNNLREREIQLDNIPAAKPAGYNPVRENAVTVPDVAQFNGLPRTCRLVIDIVYENVGLWRSYTEHAETSPFIVEEQRLSPAIIRDQIEDLYDRIEQLEKRLSKNKTPTSTNNTVQPSEGTENKTETKPTNDTVAEEKPDNDSEEDSGLSKLPIVGGIFKQLGF